MLAHLEASCTSEEIETNTLELVGYSLLAFNEKKRISNVEAILDIT
jgi:hypothetical protein